MFYVYKITNKVNGKVYIGKASDLNVRWSTHCLIAKQPEHEKHYLLHRAIAKYGEDEFLFEEIERFPTEQEALDREAYWVGFYKSNVSKYGKAFGYNLTDGGEGSSGYKHTEENKQLMSLLKQGVFDGEKNPNWGKTTSDTVRLAISKAKRGQNAGESNHNSKLKTTDIPSIRLLISQGKSDRKIAAQFGVTRNVITRIRTGESWKQVP